MSEPQDIEGRDILVTREGHEGALRIKSLSGRITSPTDEQPEWADGLVAANTAERIKWYQDKLGITPTDDAGAIEFNELGWTAMDPEGENYGVEGSLIEMDADAETRMQIIADRTGINRTADLSSAEQDDTKGELGHVLTERTMGETYTQGEARAFDEAKQADFDDVQKTGTGTK